MKSVVYTWKEMILKKIIVFIFRVNISAINGNRKCCDFLKQTTLKIIWWYISIFLLNLDKRYNKFTIPPPCHPMNVINLS